MIKPPVFFPVSPWVEDNPDDVGETDLHQEVEVYSKEDIASFEERTGVTILPQDRGEANE